MPRPLNRNVYIAIMRAASRGIGLHLTAAEVAALALDDAIATTATNSLSRFETKQFHNKSLTWGDIDPSPKREETLSERFQRDPFSNPPPCLMEPEKACLPECECGLAGPCRRHPDKDSSHVPPPPRR